MKRQFFTTLAAFRFFAASAVFFVHAALTIPFDNVKVAGYTLFSAMPVGFTAVSFFFMLSGFVLTWSMRPGVTFRSVIRRRLVRIFPSHLVCLALVVLVAYGIGHQIDLGPLLAQVFLVQTWFPDLSYLNNFNSQTWTLSAEIFFYLVFPVAFVVARRMGTRALCTLIPVLVVAIAAWSFVALLFPGHGMPHPLATSNVPTFSGALNDPDFVPDEKYLTTVTQFWAVYHFPVARLMEFVIGVSVAELMARGVRFPVPRWLVVVTWAATIGVGMFLPVVHVASAAVALSALLLLLWGASPGRSGTSTSFSRPIWITLGNLTFGFYLIHGVVLDAGHRLFGVRIVDGEETMKSWPTWEACLWIAVAFAVSMALAWVLYTFVESPIMSRWGRRSEPRVGSDTPAR